MKEQFVETNVLIWLKEKCVILQADQQMAVLKVVLVAMIADPAFQEILTLAHGILVTELLVHPHNVIQLVHR